MLYHGLYYFFLMRKIILYFLFWNGYLLLLFPVCTFSHFKTCTVFYCFCCLCNTFTEEVLEFLSHFFSFPCSELLHIYRILKFSPLILGSPASLLTFEFAKITDKVYNTILHVYPAIYLTTSVFISQVLYCDCYFFLA